MSKICPCDLEKSIRIASEKLPHVSTVSNKDKTRLYKTSENPEDGTQMKEQQQQLLSKYLKLI